MVKCFRRWFDSLVKFIYWFKFHVNIITGSGVTTICFYKGLTRNPEIGNTPVWVWPNIWRLGRVRTPLIKCYLMLQYVRVTAFTFSELLRENQQGVKLPPPLSPRLGLMNKCYLLPTVQNSVKQLCVMKLQLLKSDSFAASGKRIRLFWNIDFDGNIPANICWLKAINRNTFF